MSKSPIPLRDILNYLQLEDAEGLVPGSVKYVGHVTKGGQKVHYWSYPLNGKLAWACADDYSLGDADRVPAAIRQQTAPLKLHKVKREPAPPKNPWTGVNISEQELPIWVPTSRVRTADIEYVASFSCNFDTVATTFRATPSTDKDGGGAGSTKYFFLELSRNRLAMLECEGRRPNRIRLYVPTKEGRVYWEDYNQVMNPLGVPLEEAFRQGGLNWKHRKPTPQAVEKTKDHYQKMWIPS